MHLLPSVSGAFAHIALIIFFLLLSYSDSLSPNVDWQVQSLVVHMILVTEEMGLLTGHLEIIFLLSFPFLACLMAEHPRAEWCVEFLRQAFWMTSPCPRVLIFSALTIPWTLDPDLPQSASSPCCVWVLAVFLFLLFSKAEQDNQRGEWGCVCVGGGVQRWNLDTLAPHYPRKGQSMCMSNAPGCTSPYPTGRHMMPTGIIINQTVGYEKSC